MKRLVIRKRIGNFEVVDGERSETTEEISDEIFISLKEASRRLNICPQKLQGFSRSHYKGFPAVLEGNRYIVNARLLPEWAKRYTEDAMRDGGM